MTNEFNILQTSNFWVLKIDPQGKITLNPDIPQDVAVEEFIRLCNLRTAEPSCVASFPALPIDPKDEALVDGLMARRLAGPEPASREASSIPEDATVIPGRLAHADWCPNAKGPRCICGNAESAFDAFGNHKPAHPLKSSGVGPEEI